MNITDLTDIPDIKSAPVSAWASKPLSEDVTKILRALENGMPVTLIATADLKTCEVDDRIEEVLQDQELQDFDYIPVRDTKGSITGVLVHKEVLQDQGYVKEAMRQIHPSFLISADESLLSFVAECDITPFCLVVKGRKISGIVTLSDLQKLPVRPVLFMLITSVELLLAEWLRQNYQNEQDWLCKISKSRRSDIEEKWNQLQQSNMAIDRISTTNFCDKRDAALKLGAFPDSKKFKEWERQLKDIEDLRNAVFHAGDYALTPEKAKKVAQTVQAASEIINLLEKSLTDI
jgi:predicted transcriptional regulator